MHPKIAHGAVRFTPALSYSKSSHGRWGRGPLLLRNALFYDRRRIREWRA